MEGVDVVEDRALGEQQQVGVAARADRRVGAQRAVARRSPRRRRGTPVYPPLAAAASLRCQAGSSLKKVNFAYVRSATSIRSYRRALAALGLCVAPGPRQPPRPRPPRPRAPARRARRPSSRSPCCPATRRTSGWGASRGSRRAALSAGLGSVPRGPDLPRHQPGQPRLRTRSMTSRCRRWRSSAAGSRRACWDPVLERAEERPGRHRARAARLDDRDEGREARAARSRLAGPRHGRRSRGSSRSTRAGGLRRAPAARRGAVPALNVVAPSCGELAADGRAARGRRSAHRDRAPAARVRRPALGRRSRATASTGC